MSLSKLSNVTLLSPTRLLFLNSQPNIQKSTLHIFKTGIGIQTLRSKPIRNNKLVIPAPVTKIQLQNKSSIKLIDKRFKNLTARENFSSDVKRSSSNSEKVSEEVKNKSIFSRFKDAYKQHGKVLIYCHIASSFGWVFSFFALSHW